jgi:hypothetical protein
VVEHALPGGQPGDGQSCGHGVVDVLRELDHAEYVLKLPSKPMYAGEWPQVSDAASPA